MRAEPTQLPPGYHRQMHDVELRHWWHRGVLETEAMFLRDRLARGGQTLLDAGCGTGGFLRWAAGTGAFERLIGFDPSEEAIGLARERVPTAELSVGGASAIAQPDATADIVVCNDVLQHIHDDELESSMAELVRVVRPGGAILVRTNGGRHAEQPLPDWRLFTGDSLRGLLERSGLRVERLTHVNSVLSGWAALRGRGPKAPDGSTHGIPAVPGRLSSTIGSALLGAERSYLRSPNRALPYGHTLLALAARPDGTG